MNITLLWVSGILRTHACDQQKGFCVFYTINTVLFGYLPRVGSWECSPPCRPCVPTTTRSRPRPLSSPQSCSLPLWTAARHLLRSCSPTVRIPRPGSWCPFSPALLWKWTQHRVGNGFTNHYGVYPKHSCTAIVAATVNTKTNKLTGIKIWLVMQWDEHTHHRGTASTGCSPPPSPHTYLQPSACRCTWRQTRLRRIPRGTYTPARYYRRQHSAAESCCTNIHRGSIHLYRSPS